MTFTATPIDLVYAANGLVAIKNLNESKSRRFVANEAVNADIDDDDDSLRTVEVLIQTRILLSILEKKDRKLRQRVSLALKHCRSLHDGKALPVLLDSTMRVLCPKYYKIARTARQRLISYKRWTSTVMADKNEAFARAA